MFRPNYFGQRHDQAAGYTKTAKEIKHPHTFVIIRTHRLKPESPPPTRPGGH